MSCKSAIYAANTTAQTIATGNTINFGNVVRRFGCNLALTGGNVELKGSGYYDIDASFTIEGSAAGTTTIALYKDGVAIPGASATISTVADTISQVTIPSLTRQICCCEANITAVLTGTTATINNAAIVVEKV